MENPEIVDELSKTKPQDIDLDLMKNYLRIDFVDEENDKFIKILLSSAKSFVQNYLNWKFVDAGDDIPEEITLAVMAITEHWYKNRGIMSEETSTRELPYVFSGILNMHRNWNVTGTG